jgi:hypothetical protein
MRLSGSDVHCMTFHGKHWNRKDPAMAVSYARPDVADMVLRVYERSVHPELMDTVRETRLSVGKHTATLRVCRDGHAIEFRTNRHTFTELAVSRKAPVPSTGCSVDRRLIGYRTHTVKSAGIQYHCSYQLETIPADIYLQIHREMEMDASKSTLAVTLPGFTSASPNCLSFLSSDLVRNGLVVHSYHTFPGNGAILRVQSLFEVL